MLQKVFEEPKTSGTICELRGKKHKKQTKKQKTVKKLRIENVSVFLKTYGKWKKPDIKDHILYNPIYIKCPE